MSRFILVPRCIEMTHGISRRKARLTWHYRWGSLALIAASFTTVEAAAQRGPDLPARPGWHPREVYGGSNAGTTAADRAIVDANLAAAEALVARIGGYATPRGFEITPWWGTPVITSRDRLAAYVMMIRVHSPSKVAAAGEFSRSVSVGFNSPVEALSEPALLWDENGERIYVEVRMAAPMHGATAVYGTYSETGGTSLSLLFTSRGESPLLPVSREQYLRGQIAEAEGKNGEERKRHLAIAKGPTPYEEWVSSAAQRKKDREEMLAAMSDKAQAAKMRADLEKVDRETTELMRKNESLHRAMLGRFAQPGPGDTWRAEIAAMTPNERASTAWVAGGALVPAGTPRAQRVIRENPAFYRTRRSPVEPRAILVILGESYESANPAMHQLYRQFDWAAVKRLLDERP